MKSELRCVPHSVLPGQFVFEIWHDGQLIGQVCGADGPGVRIISKYSMTVSTEPIAFMGPIAVEVRIGDKL